jgi:hypothetical protein
MGVVGLGRAEQHLQADRAGYRDRDAGHRAGGRAAVELEAAHGQVPRHRSSAQPVHCGLDEPGQQRRHADEQEEDTGDHLRGVDVAAGVAGSPDEREQQRDTYQGHGQAPPQPALGIGSVPGHAERLDHDAAQ